MTIETVLEIITEAAEKSASQNQLADFGSGLTYHFIEVAQTFGSSLTVTETILVEDKAERISRISGQQLLELHETNPNLATDWRLD